MVAGSAFSILEHICRTRLMLNFTPLLTLAQSHEDAISDVTLSLRSNGLQVVRSFDLQSACASYPGQLCPHHHEDVCDCQLVVLLIYGEVSQPVSLIAHSNDGVTQIGLEHFPDERPNPFLESRITAVLDAVRPVAARKRAVYAAKH
jgi:hypothetical protein